MPVCALIPQTPGEVHQNTIIPPTVWQHDRGIHFWQPCIWERSKYRCREHAGRGFTEHQCALLIPLPSGPHRVISFSTSRGHYIFHPPSHEPWVNADVPSGWWCSYTLPHINKQQFPHLSLWFDVIFSILNVPLVPMLEWEKKSACLTGSHQHCGSVWFSLQTPLFSLSMEIFFN